MEKTFQKTEHSNEVTEILERQPNWLMKWGISSLFMLLLIALACAWIIKYPEIILAEVQITSPNPPVSAIAKVGGEISHLLVNENDTISRGSPLLYIRNPLAYENYLQLDSLLQTLSHQDSLSLLAQLYLPPLNKLGELQASYDQLVQAQQEIESYTHIDAYSQKIQKLRNSLTDYYTLIATSKETYKLNQEDMKIVSQEHNKLKQLYQKDIIAESDLLTNKRLLLQKKTEIQNYRASIANTQIAINTTHTNILELQTTKAEYEYALHRNFQKACKQLTNNLKTWKQRYLPEAPISGQVSFFKPWTSGEFVEVGAELISIIPLQKTAIIAQGTFPLTNSGKIKIGQKVNIKLDAFPYREYGIIDGRVAHISLLPSQGVYAIEISLPKGLKSNYENTIAFKQEMTAIAEIITEDYSFLQRIFYQFKSIYKQTDFSKHLSEQELK